MVKRSKKSPTMDKSLKYEILYFSQQAKKLIKKIENERNQTNGVTNSNPLTVSYSLKPQTNIIHGNIVSTNCLLILTLVF
jgi:hypothetical protein